MDRAPIARRATTARLGEPARRRSRWAPVRQRAPLRARRARWADRLLRDRNPGTITSARRAPAVGAPARPRRIPRAVRAATQAAAGARARLRADFRARDLQRGRDRDCACDCAAAEAAETARARRGRDCACGHGGARAPERERELAASRRAVANAEAGVRARAGRIARRPWRRVRSVGQPAAAPAAARAAAESAWMPADAAAGDGVAFLLTTLPGTPDYPTGPFGCLRSRRRARTRAFAQADDDRPG